MGWTVTTRKRDNVRQPALRAYVSRIVAFVLSFAAAAVCVCTVQCACVAVASGWMDGEKVVLAIFHFHIVSNTQITFFSLLLRCLYMCYRIRRCKWAMCCVLCAFACPFDSVVVLRWFVEGNVTRPKFTILPRLSISSNSKTKQNRNQEKRKLCGMRRGFIYRLMGYIGHSIDEEGNI